MNVAIAKWGNSLAVRLPRHIVEDAHLTDGAPVELSVRDGSVVVTPVRKKFKLSELLAAMKPENRQNETDWGKPQGEEAW